MGANDGIYRALFLCTGNSARSIMAEAILNRRGQGRFCAYSAGSQPNAHPHPLALEVLAERGYDTSDLRSKSWEEFAAAGAPRLDFILTVCDNAAGEACPVWPGQPLTAHWGAADPAAFEGPEREQRERFRHICRELEQRIERFAKLDIESLDRSSLRSRLEEIGKSDVNSTE